LLRETEDSNRFLAGIVEIKCTSQALLTHRVAMNFLFAALRWLLAYVVESEGDLINYESRFSSMKSICKLHFCLPAAAKREYRV
jgi:hypothetical protein